MSKSRKKRASESDLYRSCVLGGDCIPDVKNKVEGTTLADKLLQWFGSIVYLGGLGIGTGKGSGGTSGLRPTPPIARVPEAIPIKPIAPLETVPEVVPGIIGAEAPSIIPMTDVTLDPSVLVDNDVNIVTLGPSNEVSVLYETTTINPVYDSTVVGGPTVITGADDSIAVLDISTSAPPPRRVTLDTTYLGGGTSDITVHTDVSNVFVDPGYSGTQIGYEEIELGPIRGTFDIEEPPTRSTPLAERLVQRVSNFYNRLTRQVQVQDTLFLQRPSQLVQFGIDNPVFTDEELTLQFAQDVEAIQAAPDPLFEDVRTLHRPVYTETSEGLVRVSRLGTRGFMHTRAGTLVGENVHFYMDLSAIDSADALELTPVGTASGSNIFVDTGIADTFVDSDIVPDNELLDDTVEDFSNSQLVLTASSEERETTFVPGFSPSSFKVVSTVGMQPQDRYVFYPISFDLTPIYPASAPYEPLSHTIFSDDYYLPPSLYRRRKRKRSLSDDF